MNFYCKQKKFCFFIFKSFEEHKKVSSVELILKIDIVGVGVYISRVEEGSVAERAGLRPGDSILEVNGTPFTGISHEEALKVCVFICISVVLLRQLLRTATLGNIEIMFVLFVRDPLLTSTIR